MKTRRGFLWNGCVHRPGHHFPRIRALFLTVWLCLALQSWAAAADVLRYGGDRDFRPFEFLDEDGRPQGFQIDLLNELGRVGDFEVSIRLDDWQAIESDFRAGKLDAVAMSHTRARRLWAAFCRPHATPAMTIYHREGDLGPVSLADLAEHRIAVAESEPMRETRTDFFEGDQYRFSSLDSPRAALEAVRDGQAEYALMPRAYGDAIIAAGAVQGVVASDFSLRLQDYGFAVAPENAALRYRLDAAMNELERSGSLEALRTKWLSSHRAVAERATLEHRIVWQRIGMVLLGLAGLAAVAWLAVKLRRRVQQARRERSRRHEAEQALRLAQDKLARAFTNHPDAMVISEHGSGLVLEVNHALCQLVGTQPEALLGHALDALPAIVDPRGLAMLRGMLCQDGAFDSAPIQVRRGDGEVRFCLVSAEVFVSGDAHQVFSIIRDVTDQLRADAALREGYDALAASAREQAQALAATQAHLMQTDQELKTLAASMSHDLRAPLRAIQGFSAFLQQDVQAGRFEEAANYASRIERAARRMDDMVEALTRLSRAANRELDRKPVDMADQVREAWAIVAEAEPERQVSLLIAELPPAVGDPPLLAQVWQNLLANAFKYTAPAAEAKVGVDAFEEGGRQWYRVSDNGAGFDMGLARHLFEPFRRLHPESAFAGTGIGLSIVRRIVRRHGGDVRARGNVGVGAVFEFTLEAAGSSADAA